MKVFLSTLLFLSFVCFSIAMVAQIKAVDFNQGTYSNLCGTGTAATSNTCQRGCDPQKGTCSSNGNHVVKFICDGKKTDCRDNESGFASQQNIGNPGCGKTVQIDVFNKDCRAKGGWDCSEKDLQDYMVWYSGDCTQPYGSGNPVPVATTQKVQTQQVEHKTQCEGLDVLSGNDAQAPATVKLRAKASDNLGDIQRYRFHFGDGKQQETTTAEVSHRYESSGTFAARFEYKDSKGTWRSSGNCQTQVTVKPAPTETHRSSCSDIVVTADNDGKAPSLVTVKVNGFDNKGAIQHYRVTFDTGVTKESGQPTLEHRYEKPGTFIVKAAIKDSHGNWVEGTNCQKTVYIETKPLTTQPETGTPTVFTAVSLLSGVGGLSGLQLWHRRQKRT